MFILQVVHRFLPDYIGGIEVYTLNLCKELIRHHRICIFCGEPSSKDKTLYEQDMEYEGLRIRKVAIDHDVNTHTLVRPFMGRLIVERFEKCLDEMRPDIVHIQHCDTLPIGLISSAKCRGIPTVITMHDYSALCPTEYLLKPNLEICEQISGTQCIFCIVPHPFSKLSPIVPQCMLDRFAILCYKLFPGNISVDGSYTIRMIRLLRYYMGHLTKALLQADILITPSEHMRKRFIKCGFPENRTLHVAHGIKSNTAICTSLNKADRMRFAFIGRVTRPKGVHVLIEAFNKLSIDNIELRIHGDTSDQQYFAKLQNLIKEKNIHFFGRFEPKQIYQLLSEIDVLIIPSICCENMPLAVLEALSSKIPVIGSNIGGIAEVIKHGENGLLFQVGDVDDLAEKMKLILEDSFLVNLRKNIKPIKTMEENASELESIYLKLLCREREEENNRKFR